MKRFLSLLLSLSLLCLNVPALAEDGLILTAAVIPGHTCALKAPASGELAPFSVREGDAVQAGETLFSIEPVKVYADVSGTVALVNAGAGDIADAAVERFGAVVLVEYDERYEIHASTRTGYNNVDNRDLYVGTPVYLRSLNGEHHADGLITSVNGTEITVQIIGGDLIYTHEIRIYRDPDYAADTMVARGNISTAAPRAYSASGTITHMGAKPGQKVEPGDYLFSYVPDVLDPERRGTEDALDVLADEALIVSGVSVQAGASVSKGQTLLTFVRPGEYELCASVRESDLPLIAVGDVLTAQFDEVDLPEISATVTSISPLGTDDGEESSYTVYLAFENAEGILPGMHVTIEK